MPFTVNQTPISLGYIAASLKNAGIAVRIVDLLYPEIPCLTLSRPSVFVIKRMIEREKPSVVGFSAYNSNMEEILGIARACKEADPSIVTVIGGPQATFMPSRALKEMPSIDVIARGEGEPLLLELAEAVEDGRSFEGVRGITYREGERIVSTPKRELIKDLDSLPSPYVQGVFEMDKYPIATMLSSRGCYHSCAFCYTPRAFGGRIRLHSREYVLRDVEIACNEGVAMLWFADPCFTASRKHAAGILEGILRENYGVPIWCETRVDDVDRELLTLMGKAGVEWVFFGLESGNQETLDALHKGITLRQVKDAVRAAKEAGIKVELSIIIGLPGETREKALRTIRFAKSLGADKIAVNRLRLYFGSEIYEEYRERLRLLKPLPSYMAPGYDYEFPELPNEEIEALLREEGLLDEFFSRFAAYGKADINYLTIAVPPQYGGTCVTNVSRCLMCFY